MDLLNKRPIWWVLQRYSFHKKNNKIWRLQKWKFRLKKACYPFWHSPLIWNHCVENQVKQLPCSLNQPTNHESLTVYRGVILRTRKSNSGAVRSFHNLRWDYELYFKKYLNYKKYVELKKLAIRIHDNNIILFFYRWTTANS